jgi:hypothetical protein
MWPPPEDDPLELADPPLEDDPPELADPPPEPDDPPEEPLPEEDPPPLPEEFGRPIRTWPSEVRTGPPPAMDELMRSCGT